MTIQQNIIDKISEVIADPTGEKAEKLRAQAVAAIYAGQFDATGQGTAAWREYMRNFTNPLDDPAQLARLTGVNDPGCTATPYIREARGYLIANATCGTPTFPTTIKGVDDVLDKTMS
jgi:hypothetical protein